MRFGVREICNVVFKAVDARKIGNREFKKGEPVIYFDSLKTSTMEQATTTVYAQGGRGNTRLVAWEGEKTLTFTMEDALISEMGLAILASANLYEANANDILMVHVSEIIKGDGEVTKTPTTDEGAVAYSLELDENGEVVGKPTKVEFTEKKPNGLTASKSYLIDYYTEVNGTTSHGFQIDIEPQSFGGNFYIEADTLFRDTNGTDHAAQFVIPNGKIQSNFTLSMASSGDPSTFTFTVDAFPGYVNGDKTKKVMATIQVIEEGSSVVTGDVAGDKADADWYPEAQA